MNLSGTSDRFNNPCFFDNREMVLLSIHQKEKVIGPLMKDHFGIDLTVSTAFNTDAFGTFTGEIKRPDTQLNTLRLKIEKGIHLHPDKTLFIASEGSFNPFPFAPFVTLNMEMIMVKDTQLDLEMIGKHSSLETNMDRTITSSATEAIQFAYKNRFPSHGMIVSPAEHQHPFFIKGITSEEELKKAIEECIDRSNNKTIQIETDMRACFNPTRMKNIGLATEDLIRKMKNFCPSCHSPGFSVVDHIPGLLCENCGQKTKLIKQHLLKCSKCNYWEIKEFPEGNLADPMYCDLCNP